MSQKGVKRCLKGPIIEMLSSPSSEIFNYKKVFAYHLKRISNSFSIGTQPTREEMSQKEMSEKKVQ